MQGPHDAQEVLVSPKPEPRQSGSKRLQAALTLTHRENVIFYAELKAGVLTRSTPWRPLDHLTQPGPLAPSRKVPGCWDPVA